MNENLKRHKPDIKALGEGKAIAFMPEDPMGVWVHIQEVCDLLDVKDRTIRDFEENWIPRPKTFELKPIRAGSPELGEYWVYDAEDVDRIIAEKDKEIVDLKKKLAEYEDCAANACAECDANETVIEPRGNTLETIENECSEPGWFYTYDNRPNEAISAKVIQRAKMIRPHVPMEMELFAAPDGSVQWEDNLHALEVYADKFKYDDEEVSFADAVERLESLEYNNRPFKLELSFPKAFRETFQSDRFAGSLRRIFMDLETAGPLWLSKQPERNLVETLIDVFKNAKVVK